LGSYDLTLTGGLFGATASISGNLDLSGRFVADTIASHSFAGDLSIGDDLTVTGNLSWGSLGSTIDISDDTNLTGGRSLTMNGDAIDADAELYRTQERRQQLHLPTLHLPQTASLIS